MAGTNSNGLIDPNSGFCSQTKTFHSVRPKIPLPPSSQPLSVTQFTLSLLHKSATTTAAPFLMNAATGRRLTYPEFLRQTNSLTLSLQKHYSLSKNDVAFILSPSSFEIPVLYFSLLSLGVVVSPANPLGSTSEISHQLHLSKPSIAFATSRTSHKLPPNIRTVLVDSPEFLSLLSTQNQNDVVISPPAVVNQSDAAVLLYSSGTTGKVKGVLLTHRNIISLVASFHHVEYGANPAEPQPSGEVSLITLPLFHVFGFLALVRVVAVSETAVFMERFDFETMLKTVDKYKLTSMPVSPPLVVALTKSELTKKYDLSSLQYLSCGGAPLGKEVTDKFKEKFPSVEIIQGYGLTECGGLASSMRDSEETKRHGSVGRLHELMEAKIVDPVTGDALSPGQKGELWLRGPTIMKGYIGDNKATIETVDSEGWLKTGDLCYFDSNGFLFIVDRLKELIKYKAYQVPPAELEHLLQSNPEIADAAVIPYPDEEAGQIPMAFVVRKPGSSINEAQLMDFIAKQVAPYKKIRRVAFVNSIPKSEAGKILRRELVIHFENYGKLLERDLDVSVYVEEHMLLKYNLSKISHRFRIFLLLEFLVVTATQFAALLEITGKSGIINFVNGGDFAVSSIVELVGIVICLNAAAKISHRAQGLGSVASRWHASVTCGPYDDSHLGMTNNMDSLETAYPSGSVPRYYSGSDLESADYVPTLTNAQLASYMSMYHKQQAFVTYLQSSPGGATVFGWTIDRTLINTIFFIQLSLVLFVLGKTVSFTTK